MDARADGPRGRARRRHAGRARRARGVALDAPELHPRAAEPPQRPSACSRPRPSSHTRSHATAVPRPPQSNRLARRWRKRAAPEAHAARAGSRPGNAGASDATSLHIVAEHLPDDADEILSGPPLQSTRPMRRSPVVTGGRPSRSAAQWRASRDADIHHAEGVLRLFGLAPEAAAEVARRPLPSAQAGDGGQ